MQPKELEQLLEKYNKGEATPAEKALIESWYLTYRNDGPNASHQQLEEDQQESLNKLLFQINSTSKRSYTRAFAIAASVLVFITAGVLMFMHHQPAKQQFAASKPVKNDIAPGGNKAILTLANGSTVVLTDAKNGKLASQGGVVVSKTADGQVKYAGSTTSSTTLVYNTATTPKGGQYQFILSDGTKVWLNSASSIKYPVNFIGNERKVELTGEAYFEVAHNAAKPFRVVSSGQTVEVLGTHFNINAYADENGVKTTLLQGSVKVSSAYGGSSIIKPGEQAQFNNGKINVVSDVDLDAAVAWKNGLFNFEDSNIQEVMRQFARWYDVDVKYEGELPSRHFSGEIPRNLNATQMLDILSFKKIHYKLQGKTIIVMP
jgi:transmembrane sensor